MLPSRATMAGVTPPSTWVDRPWPYAAWKPPLVQDWEYRSPSEPSKTRQRSLARAASAGAAGPKLGLAPTVTGAKVVQELVAYVVL